MFILSIDIGIKNLAYCLLESNENSCKIVKWDIVNLTNETKCFCQGILKKTNNVCNKTAAYTKNNKFYCKTHAKSHEFIIPCQDLNFTILKRKKLYEIKEIADKYHINHTTPITKTNLLNVIKQFLDQNLFENIKKTKCNKIDFITLGKNIPFFLDSLVDEFPIDAVLIENQISSIAVRMKTLQGMIAQYFIMKKIKSIQFISSLNKLKTFVKSKKRTTYKERKKLGIFITDNLLIENLNFQTWKEYFNNNSKKDDLADSFLQGIWYIKNNNLSIINSSLKNL